MATLRKRDVEHLLDTYDHDPVEALTVALRVALDRPDDDFAELVAAASIEPRRRARLLARDTDALDELARELNETRELRPQEHS